MKSYFRFLSRHPLYTFINVAGLAVSLMFVLLIGDYAWRQLSIDRWHRSADRTYLLASQNDTFSWLEASHSMGQLFPEIEQTCCLQAQAGKIKAGVREFVNPDDPCLLLADSTFLDMFDFELVEGDRRTALNAPDKCLITETLARDLFPDRPAVGQSLQVVGHQTVYMGPSTLDSTLAYTVAGVLRDFDRTVLPNGLTCVVNMHRFPQVMGYRMDNHILGYSSCGPLYTYYRFAPGASPTARQEDMLAYLRQQVPILGLTGIQQVQLVPLTDLLFAPQNKGHGLQKGDRRQLFILLSAMVVVLFFAVSNYINLTVANTGFRAKEVATCRLLGSTTREVGIRFIRESTFLVLVSFCGGLLLALAFQDDLQTLFQGKIALQHDVSVVSVAVSAVFVLALGIVSGIVPSLQMARFNPMDIAKGTFRFRSKMVLGRVFLSLQSVITFVMLLAALVIFVQIRHLVSAPLGYHTKNLFQVRADNSEVLRDRLNSLPFVQRIGCTAGTGLSGYSVSMMTRKDTGGQAHVFLRMDLDSTALDLYGLQLLSHRGIGTSEEAWYLNEEAVRCMGMSMDDTEVHWGDGKTEPVAGVFQDFHKNHILDDYIAFLIRIRETANIKHPDYLVQTDGSAEAFQQLRQVVAEADGTDESLDYKVCSVEANIAKEFADTENILHIILLFTLIALLVSGMGFVGMSLFFIRQRKKEIGIRKILGGSSREVIVRMLRLFCMPVLLSFGVSVPLSAFLLDGWLQHFSYRIALHPWMFLAVGAVLLGLAVVSVFFQLWRAVRANPVESVKVE
ncbi:MAG: ABC transporter permease [Bacteroidales bacterium]|nr:ABC transporter permease [Bacteroidales bacterium]